MKQHNIKHLALVMSMATVLTACGGGGDDNQDSTTGNSGVEPGSGSGIAPGSGSNTPITPTNSLAKVINDYRKEKGLKAIPVSSSLTKVAKKHVEDLQNNNPVKGQCNLHSWSDKGNGQWTACCYTSDHANASCMWNKPAEITNKVYTGSGYEIAYMHSGKATPIRALIGWQNSPGHHDLILNKNTWTKKWEAMGAAVSKNYAVVWFGHQADPAK